MHQYVIDLIALHRSSVGSANIDLAEELMEYLSIEKDKANRKAAYSIIEGLIKNTNDSKLLQFYINQTLVETDKYLISSMLSTLIYINKDLTIDITPILKHVESDKGIIRGSAIKSLENTPHKEAKEKLREVLQWEDHKKHKYDILDAMFSIFPAYEAEDLEYFRPLLSSPSRDIKRGAKFAVEIIEDTIINKPKEA